MLFRAGICFAFSNATLLVWDYLRVTAWRGRGAPLGFGGVLLGALLIYRTSTFVGAMALALFLLPPFPTPAHAYLFLGLTGILGLWSGAILLQLERNVLRRFLGVPPEPIRWAPSPHRA